ncbi:hypothetical protein RYX36_018414 [Vicia faba]
MCDRVLPGERFIGSITRKKGNYAEATKLQTLTPPFHTVYAPCVMFLIVVVARRRIWLIKLRLKLKRNRFSQKELELHGIMKPIVPCDIQFHYRNKMEFSFGPYKWLPKELLHEGNVDGGSENYALGLHVPGFFDKIINVDKCLLQTDPANKMSSAAGKTPALGQAIYSASKFALNGAANPTNPGNTLYVTGLSSRVTERDLEDHFSKEGKVASCFLIVEPRTRISRGFAFVTMDSHEDVERCIKHLNQSVLEGRYVTVERSRRKRARTPTPGHYLGLKNTRDYDLQGVHHTTEAQIIHHSAHPMLGGLGGRDQGLFPILLIAQTGGMLVDLGEMWLACVVSICEQGKENLFIIELILQL